MLEASLSLRRFLPAAALIAAIGAEACATTIVFDPGHGGNTGNPGPSCMEDNLNWLVAVELEARWGRIEWSPFPVYADFTKTSMNQNPSYAFRTAFANNLAADAFFSIHHNGAPNPPAQPCKGYVMYANCPPNPPCTVQCEQNAYSSSSQSLAQDLTYGYDLFLGFDRTYYVEPPKHDITVRTDWTCGADVLIGQPRPAVIGEAFFMTCSMEAVACYAPNYPYDPVIADEARAYVYAVEEYFNVTLIGTSFQAAGGANWVTLTWTEGDLSRSVWYDLYRADNCHGPFALMNSVS